MDRRVLKQARIGDVSRAGELETFNTASILLYVKHIIIRRSPQRKKAGCLRVQHSTDRVLTVQYLPGSMKCGILSPPFLTTLSCSLCRLTASLDPSIGLCCSHGYLTQHALPLQFQNQPPTFERTWFPCLWFRYAHVIAALACRSHDTRNKEAQRHSRRVRRW